LFVFKFITPDSDWDNSPDHTYAPRRVDEKVLEYFDAHGDNIARRYSNWGNWKLQVNVSQAKWNTLKINPQESWPSRYDDDSEFWVANAYSKPFHRYAIVENGEQKETGWKPVAENLFWANDSNLGMTLVTKPYGFFEDEKTTSATPPGMAYIAKPTTVNGRPTGSNEYGRWNTNSSGTSFWEFYGQYRLLGDLMGGSSSRYGWNDYDDWDRNYRHDRKPYYGQNDRYGTYGHGTYGANSRYGRSSYAKQNPGSVREANAAKPTRAIRTSRKGGKRAQTASVRGAGKSARGRGPGGRGK